MIEEIRLNLIPNGVSPVCHVSQYDEGRQIKINLFEGINPYVIQSGDTFTLNVRKPDNTIITTSVSGTQGNNYITISTTEQIAAVVGENLCELKITNGSTVIGTLNFVMQVERDVLADGVPSQSVIEDLDERIAEAIGDNYYNKTETDALLALKADKSELYNVYPTEQESGAIASFTDGADNIPVKSLVSQIVAVESGNGQPKSPDNPYTISGFDNGVVSVCGVNVWDEEWEVGAFEDSTGNKIYSANRIRSKNFIPALPNTTYGFYFPSRASASTGNIRVFFYDENKTFISFQNWIVAGTFTTPSDTKYMMFYTNGSYGETYLNDISILYPSDTTPEYHAYNGNTYTFTFGQTVYGGYFDNKGNLVDTDDAVLIGDLTWTDQSIANHVFTAIITGKKNAISSGVPDNLSCEIYDTLGGDYVISGTNNSIGGSTANSRIFVCDTRFNSASDFKTACASYKIKYKLTTPITLAITSQDIPTLLGENNIFSNCGDVEVNYYTDKADEIVEVAKATASTPLHNYSTDEQVVGTWIDGKPLYQKTIVIAGASLTAGQSNSIPHGISDIDYIQLVTGTYTFGDGEDKLPLPFADNYKPVTESVVVIEAISSSTIRIGVGSNYQGAVAPNTVWMTVQYTKTTDFASST